ncbi:kinase-like domain-containing protein [Mycena vulgaris]|nr:kinase-like domain-containing protein [Mycena vulgaris]
MDVAKNIAEVTPVPGLLAAFKLFSFIVGAVPEVQASRRQMTALASTIGQLLKTLNTEFSTKRLMEENCAKPLKDLKSLLEDINHFTHKESGKKFFKTLLQKEGRISDIDTFYRRIGMIINEFQITSLLNVQAMLKMDEGARIEDAESLATRLDGLERNQRDLREALDVNQSNMIAMMVSIQRQLEAQPTPTNNPEQQFYAHALEYLSSTSGKKVEPEDWMIPAFEVDYGPEIGSGGFGTVYRGTWNRTEIAIKCVHTFEGMKPNISLLRKEIDVWLNLRHPNILQFLGANTLDDKPFIVMPYVPYNARQFLQRHTGIDPIYILRDISLGLEYLHSRKICHGDLKGINVLVDDLGRAQLCDFGLTRIKADITSRTAQIGNIITSGSRNWMAPEMFAGSPARLPSDIYAFGMTLYELYTAEIPLSSVAFNDFVEVVLRMGVRPERSDPEDIPRLTDSLWDLAQSCWTTEPRARPTARHVHDTLAHLIKDMNRRAAQMRSHSTSIVSTNPSGHSQASSSTLSGVLPPSSAPPQSISHSGSTTAAHTSNLCLEPILREGRSLGQHPHEASASMQQDARDYNELEKLLEAGELGVKLVDNQTTMLGDDDPDTVKSTFILAATHAAMGELSKAQELTTAVMHKRARALGNDHPDTLRSMSSLAVTYQRMGQWTQAEELGATVLDKQTRILGQDHPETLISMHNLSVTNHELGRLQEAARLQEFVTDSRRRILGADHPDTLCGMFSLAGTYHKLGQFEDAEDLAKLVVEKRGQTFGREHPATLSCMFSLAGTYHKLGKFREAGELTAEVLDTRTKALGPEHPETLLAMHNLAVIYYAAGKLEDAIQLAMDVIDREEQVLGVEHPYTQRSTRLLDQMLQSLS